MYKKPNIFRSLFSFSGKMGRGEFWSELGVRLISFLCACIIACIIICVTVQAEFAVLMQAVDVVVSVLGILWGLSILAMTRRRLRDAGFSAKSYLWLLLPGIGWILFVVRLCGDSQ